MVALDLDAHAHARRLSAGAVVVQEILALVDAVGQARDRLAHLGLGQIVHAVERGADRGGAMLLAEPHQPRLGRPRRRHLGQNVALAFGRAAQVGEQEVELLLVDAVGREQAQRRDAHALLPGLGRGGEVAARPGAADIAPMGEAHGKGEEAAFEENGTDRLHVGQVVAAHLGQVEVPDVTRLQALGRHAFEEFLHREAHDAEMNRNVAALGDQVALVVGEGRRKVARLAQQRRARRAHDDERHLLGRCRQRMADDFDGEGIDRVLHELAPELASLIQRWPIASARST